MSFWTILFHGALALSGGLLLLVVICDTDWRAAWKWLRPFVRAAAAGFGLLLLCTAFMAFLLVMSGLGAADALSEVLGQPPEPAENAGVLSTVPDYDPGYEENPCGGLIQQARITARDRAARERAEKEKGGGL